MVKFIIDFNGESLTKKVLIFSDAFLIIKESCFLDEAQTNKYKISNNFDSLSPDGNYFYRTSSDIEKGIIIGRLLHLYPDARVFSNNSELLKKVLPKLRINPLTQAEESKEKQIKNPIEKPKDSITSPIIENRLEEKKNKEVSPVMIIPPRPYQEPQPAKNPEPQPAKNPEPQPAKNPILIYSDPPQFHLPKGPIISAPRPLIPSVIDNKKKDQPNVHAELDPILRNANPAPIMPNIQPMLRPVFEELRQISSKFNKFHQLFQYVSSKIQCKSSEDFEMLKKFMVNLFECGMFSFKYMRAEIRFFENNCWNLDIETR